MLAKGSSTMLCWFPITSIPDPAHAHCIFFHSKAAPICHRTIITHDIYKFKAIAQQLITSITTTSIQSCHWVFFKAMQLLQCSYSADKYWHFGFIATTVFLTSHLVLYFEHVITTCRVIGYFCQKLFVTYGHHSV